MAGVEFKNDKTALKIFKETSKNGLVTTLVKGNIIRITPPLIIQAEELKKEFGLAGTEANGGKDVSEVVETSIRYILGEIKSVILQYEKDHHRAVSKLVLTGGGARLLGLREYLETRVK